MTETSHSETHNPEALPFVAPCRRVDVGAPVHWVAAGWADYRRAPRQALGFGIALVIVSWLLAATAWYFGGFFVLIGLMSGFVFVGPVVALALYSVSCQLERGRRPSLGYCFFESHRNLGNEAIMGLVLMVVLLLWARAASLVHVFFPIGSGELTDLMVFLGIGTAVGSIFALIVFSATAFSLPMIMDRQADMITSVITSVNAVLRNKPAMAVWVGIIVLGVLVGFLTAFIGLAVVIPVLGFATWHAYRDTIDASAWPRHEPPA